MKSCLTCMMMILILTILICGGGLLYMQKGCGFSVDKIVSVDQLPYDTGIKWIVRGNNTEYILASDSVFSIMKPEELAEKLQIGHTYKMRTCGFDVPLIKYNKIIINVEEISK